MGIYIRFIIGLLIGIFGFLNAGQAGIIFDRVKKAGFVKCGISYKIPGFASYDAQENLQGFDVDLCKAVAITIFGDQNRVQFIEVLPSRQYDALKKGEIDLLATSTSNMFQSDTLKHIEFSSPVFFDTEGFLVSKSLGTKTVEDIKDVRVCVPNIPEKRAHLDDFFKKKGITYLPIVKPTLRDSSKSYLDGNCEVFFGESSQLLAFLTLIGSQAQNSKFYRIPGSKIILSAAVAEGDQSWLEIVRWTINLLIFAEELGINSKNIKQLEKFKNSLFTELMERTQGTGKALGVSPLWVTNLIEIVGNYGEIYARNFGYMEPLGLVRGLNKLWFNGGLIYSTPFN